MLMPCFRVIRGHFVYQIFQSAYLSFTKTCLLGRLSTLKLELQPNIFKNVVVKLIVKLLAQSDLIIDGMPTS